MIDTARPRGRSPRALLNLWPYVRPQRALALGWLVFLGLSSGATLLCGGPGAGLLLPASVLENVPHAAQLWREEAFGPLALLEPFDDFDMALRSVNDSDYGLQAGLFTDSLEHTLRAWDELQVGGVVVNDVPSFRVDNMPYGGVKRSGQGREGIRAAIAEMTEPRLLVIRDSMH